MTAHKHMWSEWVPAYKALDATTWERGCLYCDTGQMFVEWLEVDPRDLWRLSSEKIRTARALATLRRDLLVRPLRPILDWLNRIGGQR